MRSAINLRSNLNPKQTVERDGSPAPFLYASVLLKCRVSVRVRRASGGHRDRRDRCSDSDRHTRSCSEPDSYADTRSGFQRNLCSYFYA